MTPLEGRCPSKEIDSEVMTSAREPKKKNGHGSHSLSLGRISRKRRDNIPEIIMTVT